LCKPKNYHGDVLSVQNWQGILESGIYAGEMLTSGERVCVLFFSFFLAVVQWVSVKKLVRAFKN